LTATTIQREKDLFAQIANGDETAFGEIYKLYVPQLLPFINNMVRTDAVADEVIQETFLRVWISRDKLTEILEPRAWVFRIASNICYTYLKRHITERSIIESMSGSNEKPAYEETDAVELTRIVKEAVHQLSPQRQKIYRLSREGGLSIQQIADNLGISVPTVKNTITQSLKFIRDYLEDKGYSIPLVIIVLLFS
jgi:RNA polymerase sigma-70 factor (ECF subfamily)